MTGSYTQFGVFGVIGALGLDPEKLIEWFGLVGIWAIVFAESGLLVGFFLPGDALLFTAGFFASEPSSIPDELHLSLVPLIVGIVVAAIAGDQVGYLFGRRVGPALFRRPDSRFFKQQNVDKAREYFDRYGPRTIVLARFVPIVRTFAPIVAGVSGMDYRTFVRWNVIGGLLWGVGVTLLGYWLGQIDVIAENIELTIVAVVGLSCLPIAFELWKARKERRAGDPVTEAILAEVDRDE
jgi:membrane-associated protein